MKGTVIAGDPHVWSSADRTREIGCRNELSMTSTPLAGAARRLKPLLTAWQSLIKLQHKTLGQGSANVTQGSGRDTGSVPVLGSGVARPESLKELILVGGGKHSPLVGETATAVGHVPGAAMAGGLLKDLEGATMASAHARVVTSDTAKSATGETMAHLAALRQVLTGESVVEMSQLWFRTREGVNDFLRLHQFDPDASSDVNALWALHHEAIDYLEEVQEISIPKEVAEPKEIQDIFLLAANGASRVRRAACMTLKVLHTLHHLCGRELLFNTATSESMLFNRLNTRMLEVADGMRAAGIRMEEFSAGQKSRNSMVTKLLSKRSILAAHIFDKMRFRIVLENRDDLVRALMYLTSHVVPFNYVVPGQSQNGLVGLEDILRVCPAELGGSREEIEQFWSKVKIARSRENTPATPPNEFSGSSYRCVNFVVDIPMRIDDIADHDGPAIIAVQAEIQVMDAEAAKSNEEGENAHHLYKARQRERVRRRLDPRRLHAVEEGGEET